MENEEFNEEIKIIDIAFAIDYTLTMCAIFIAAIIIACTMSY